MNDTRERREAVLGTDECPRCGKVIPLIAETACWTQAGDGSWAHSAYGPAQGSCCGRLAVDSWDGRFVYYLAEGDGDG